MTQHFFPLRSIKTRVTLFTLSIFVASLWALSFHVSRMLQKDMQRLMGVQQLSTASLVAREINKHLTDRIQALESISKQLSPAVMGNAATLQTLLEQRPLLPLLFNGGAWVTGVDGTVIADIPRTAQRMGVNYLDRDAIAAALKDGNVSIGQASTGKLLKAPVFPITVPVRDAQGKVIGALTGVTNLGNPNFLDQIALSQYGQTGGYVLISVQHRQVISATDKSRVMELLPAVGVNPWVDKFTQGYEGSAVAINPLGVEVLVSGKGVPVANWYVLAALPTSEAFGPIHDMQQRMLWATVLLSLLAGGLTWWILRRQLAPLVATARAMDALSKTQQIPLPLPVLSQDEVGQLSSGFNHLIDIWTQRESALSESEFRWKFAIEGAGDGLWDWNILTGKAFYSPRYKTMLGFAEDEMGDSAEEWTKRIHPDDAPGVFATMQPYMAGQPGTATVEFRMLCKDGGWLWIQGRGMVVERDAQGQPLRMIGTNTDISARKQAESQLQLSASVFNHSREGIMITQPDGSIIDVNPAFTRITGYTREEMLGRNPRSLSSGRHDASYYAAMWASLLEHGYWDSEVWNRRKNGEVFAVLQTISAVRDAAGGVKHYVSLFSDITQRKTLEDQVRQLAFYDVLTGLPNRRMLGDRLTQSMAASKRTGLYGALMFLDLDNFKPLNDTHGHGMGDLLLIEVAQRLSACVREMDTVGRIGGDEFVVMLSELDVDKAASTKQARTVAEKIRAALAAPYQLTVAQSGDQITTVEHLCSASIGVVVFLNHEASLSNLQEWADAAMYQAKAAGRNVVRFHGLQNFELSNPETSSL